MIEAITNLGGNKTGNKPCLKPTCVCLNFFAEIFYKCVKCVDSLLNVDVGNEEPMQWLFSLKTVLLWSTQYNLYFIIQQLQGAMVAQW